MGKGIVHRIGVKYVEGGVRNASEKVKNAYVLSDNQKTKIKSISRQTYFLSALIGALAVLLVVLPDYLWPEFFGTQNFVIFGNAIEFKVYYMIYGVLMLFPEIWSLNYVNLRAVRNIAEVCNYPNKTVPDFEDQIDLLTEAGLEMPAKHLALFNIDPYIGLSKFSYYSFFIFAKLKATLSNLVVKLVVKRFLGRYALRIVTDLAGIPIFAFWNAWASRQVIREAKMRLMAAGATEDFMEEITEEDMNSVQSKMTPLFHFLAQQKRAYNFALYAYLKEVVRRLPNVNLENKKEIELEELFTESKEQNILVAKMLVFGLMVDGSLSIREKTTLRKLGKMDWFPYSLDQLENAVDQYNDGFGLMQL